MRGAFQGVVLIPEWKTERRLIPWHRFHSHCMKCTWNSSQSIVGGWSKNTHHISGCSLPLWQSDTYTRYHQSNNYSSHGLKGKTLLTHACSGIKARSASSLLLRSKKELFRKKAKTLMHVKKGKCVQRNSMWRPAPSDFRVSKFHGGRLTKKSLS